MNSFDFKDVTLEEGILKNTLVETLDFYLNIPNDNILKYMRESAGRPAPGILYTGWFPNSRGIALIGQWLSAYSRMYAISGKEAFREKAVFLANEFWLCLEEAADKEPFLTARSHYDLEKLLRAYCDLHLYCDYSAAIKRGEFLVDFAERTLSKENIFGDNSTEWYTLTESFLDAYEILGIKKALDVSRLFEYREFWDLFYKDEDPFSKRPKAGFYSEFCHAYSHVNSFNSCSRAYEITKDPYYLKAALSFYQFMQQEEVMATGGYGSNFEHLMPKNRIIDALRTGHDSFETQCDTYAAYRLCKYLTRFTNSPQYGNWIETLLYNATAATIPMTEDGHVIYYSDYNMYGASKKNRQDGWTCCTGTRPLLVTEIPRLIYFEDGADLYVSQYVPSMLRFTREAQVVTLRQTSEFPAGDTVRFTISCSSPISFPIHFRMPGWLSGSMCITKNAQPLSANVDAKGWLVIENEWADGDTLEVALPKAVWMHSFDKIKDGPNAFLSGPIVLAAEYTGIQTPHDHMDIKSLTTKMRPVSGKPLHYTVDGIDSISFRPFYELKENERYFLYHDTTAHATKFY